MAKARKNERVGEEISYADEQYERQLGERAFTLEGFSEAEMGKERPLGHIEDALNREIIGQPQAIESVITALYRENFRNPDGPIVSMLLLGPTGTGKTELAQVLSRLLHGNEDDLLMIHCSEISENHRVSALLGATPEYVGREQPPLLDRKKIEKPRSIVLFDEIEKGAPALRDLLLQILDKGEITLLKDGRKVSFRNSIVLFTSNIGANEMKRASRTFKPGFQTGSVEAADRQLLEKAALSELERGGLFRPELLNRIDEKIVFNQLTDDDLEEILDRHVRKANAKYAEQGLHVTLSPELRHELVVSCNEGPEDRRVYNARPVIRKYKKYVEGITARLLSTGGIRKDSHVHAVLSDDDAPLQERVKIYHKPVERQANVPTGQVSTSKELVKREKNLPAVTNSNVTISLAAAAGVAALLVGDYLSSRRRTRRA